MKKTVFVLLACLLALAACIPLQPATSAGPNMETMVAMTFEALTAAAPPPTAQAIGLPVSDNNISFTIPLELNASATASTNTDVEFPHVNPSGGPMAEHVVFDLTNYPVEGGAKIMVFKASEYAAYGTSEQRVVTALLAGQDAIQPLPDTLLYSKIFALAKPVLFQNGHGLRYVIKEDTAIAPITNRDLFYYYMGITNDGAYFVAALFHVNASFLAADSNSPTPSDGIPFNYPADPDFEKYKAEVTQKLNDTPPENYAPSLILLDKMIESIQVINP